MAACNTHGRHRAHATQPLLRPSHARHLASLAFAFAPAFLTVSTTATIAARTRLCTVTPHLLFRAGQARLQRRSHGGSVHVDADEDQLLASVGREGTHRVLLATRRERASERLLAYHATCHVTHAVCCWHVWRAALPQRKAGAKQLCAAHLSPVPSQKSLRMSAIWAGSVGQASLQAAQDNTRNTWLRPARGTAPSTPSPAYARQAALLH
jgi:hypothetical protein